MEFDIVVWTLWLSMEFDIADGSSYSGSMEFDIVELWKTGT